MSSPAAELRNVLQRYAFDTTCLAACLQKNVPNCQGPIEVQHFASGQTNPTFLVRTAQYRYVLRRKPAGKLLPSAHTVVREFRRIVALANTAVPVAKAHALCEDPAVIGTAFSVMDYVEGRPFWDAALPEVMAALHAMDHSAAGLADCGELNPYTQRQVARCSQQYRATETTPTGAMD